MTKGVLIMFGILLLVFVGVGLFGFNLNGQKQSEDRYYPIVPESPPSQSACRKTGCSSQVCSDKDVTTDCMYKEEYICYQKAVCERQQNGECGWTQTSDLQACLKQYE